MCDSSYDKWVASAMAGVLFLIISSPYMYEITDTIAQKLGVMTTDFRCAPTISGLMVHSVVYGLIVRLMMDKGLSGCVRPYDDKTKWKIALIAGLIFAIISSPYSYELTDSLANRLGLNISIARAGCPTTTGLALHSLVFTLITRWLMK